MADRHRRGQGCATHILGGHPDLAVVDCGRVPSIRSAAGDSVCGMARALFTVAVAGVDRRAPCWKPVWQPRPVWFAGMTQGEGRKSSTGVLCATLEEHVVHVLSSPHCCSCAKKTFLIRCVLLALLWRREHGERRQRRMVMVRGT